MAARLSNLEYLEGEEDLRFVINAEQLLGEAEEASSGAIWSTCAAG